jgi:hypothetical protein
MKRTKVQKRNQTIVAVKLNYNRNYKLIKCNHIATVLEVEDFYRSRGFQTFRLKENEV